MGKAKTHLGSWGSSSSQLFFPSLTASLPCDLELVPSPPCMLTHKPTQQVPQNQLVVRQDQLLHTRRVLAMFYGRMCVRPNKFEGKLDERRFGQVVVVFAHTLVRKLALESTQFGFGCIKKNPFHHVTKHVLWRVIGPPQSK